MASPQGDSLRYFAMRRQAAHLASGVTFGGSRIWFDIITKPITAKQVVVKDVPQFMRNNRWGKRKGQTQTTYQEITIEGRCDSTQLGHLLTAATGAVTGPSTKVWTWVFGGQASTTIDATHSFLFALLWGEGLAGSWEATNAQLSKLTLKMSASGTWDFTAVFFAPDVTFIGQVSDAYAPVADNTPFMPFETTLTGPGGVAKVTDFEIMYDNALQPFFCTPQALPAAGVVHGLHPDRFTYGDVNGTFKLVCEFLAASYAANNPYYDSERDVAEAWTILSQDADTDLGSGVHPTMEIDTYDLFGKAQDIDRSKANVFQSIDGDILYNDSAATGLKIKLTNAVASGGYDGV